MEDFDTLKKKVLEGLMSEITKLSDDEIKEKFDLNKVLKKIENDRIKSFMKGYVEDFIHKGLGNSNFQLALVHRKDQKVLFTNYSIEKVFEELLKTRENEKKEDAIRKQALKDSFKYLDKEDEMRRTGQWDAAKDKAEVEKIEKEIAEWKDKLKKEFGIEL